MVSSIVLGMGLPTVAVYIILALTVAPAMIQADVPPLVAIDAFMGWTPDYTMRMAERLAPYNLAWIEDPVPTYAIDELREIRKATKQLVPLALGNFCYSRWDCQRVLEEGLADLLQPDIAWAGGITEALRMAEMAHSFGVPITFHNTSEQPWAIALMAGLPDCNIVEHVDRGDKAIVRSLFVNAPLVEDGRIRPNTITLGNELDMSVFDDAAVAFETV